MVFPLSSSPARFPSESLDALRRARLLGKLSRRAHIHEDSAFLYQPRQFAFHFPAAQVSEEQEGRDGGGQEIGLEAAERE